MIYPGYRSTPRRCGSNSVVECNLAKVDVAGSNPVSRSSQSHPETRRSPPSRRVFAFVPFSGAPGTHACLPIAHRPLPSARSRPESRRALSPWKPRASRSPQRTPLVPPRRAQRSEHDARGDPPRAGAPRAPSTAAGGHQLIKKPRSVPGARGLHRPARPIVLRQQLLRPRHAPRARRPLRTVLAPHVRRRRRRIELRRVQVETARHAVDVVVVTARRGRLRTTRLQGLLLALRELLFPLHRPFRVTDTRARRHPKPGAPERPPTSRTSAAARPARRLPDVARPLL